MVNPEVKPPFSEPPQVSLSDFIASVYRKAADSDLNEARERLRDVRKSLVDLSYLLLSGFSNPSSVLTVAQAWFTNFDEQTDITEKFIALPKVSLSKNLTDYKVEKGVREFSANNAEKLPGIFRRVRGRNEVVEFVLTKKQMRKFGEAVSRPHIVWTKVIQERNGVKGGYGKGDSMRLRSEFKIIYEKMLVRRKKEASSSLHSTPNAIK